MEQFFFLTNSGITKDLGVNPQIEKFHDGFHMSDRFALWYPVDKMSTIRASGLTLKYHAKVTDLISLVAISISDAMLISQRFYELLGVFDCIEWVTADAAVAHRNRSFDFKFIHFPYQEQRFLDYQRTVFYMAKPNGDLDQRFNLRNHDDYISFVTQYRLNTSKLIQERVPFPTFGIETLHFSDQAPDFFVFLPQSCVVISEKLKNALEAANITGIQFKPVSDYRPFGVKLREHP